MILQEIANNKTVNIWNRVALLLDKLFGFKSDNNSKLRRVKQGFDQKTGEHVIYLEYRSRATNQSPIPKTKERTKLLPQKNTK